MRGFSAPTIRVVDREKSSQLSSNAFKTHKRIFHLCVVGGILCANVSVSSVSFRSEQIAEIVESDVRKCALPVSVAAAVEGMKLPQSCDALLAFSRARLTYTRSRVSHL
jgi:hypothetical protein